MNTINDWLLKLSIAAFAVITPVKPLMLAAGFLILVDFITGIWASLKRGQPVTSFKMRRTIAKMLAYQMAILAGFVIEAFMIPELPVSKVVGAVIAMTEGKSLFENLSAITGINFWSAILDKIQGKPLDVTNIERKE